MCFLLYKALMKIQEGESSYRMRRAIGIKPGRTTCAILDLKKPRFLFIYWTWRILFLFIYWTWRIRGARRISSRSFCTGSSPQSRTQRCPCSSPAEKYDSNEKLTMKNRDRQDLSTVLSRYDVLYDSACVGCRLFSWSIVKLNVHLKSLEILLRWGFTIYDIYVRVSGEKNRAILLELFKDKNNRGHTLRTPWRAAWKLHF